MFHGVSIWQLLVILAIVVLLFGTKKLKSIGSDLGGALKGFRSAMKDEERPAAPGNPANTSEGRIEDKAAADGGRVIDSEAVKPKNQA